MEQELNTHKLAYLNLFRAVLKRRNLSPNAQEQSIAELEAYLRSNVHNTDQFIEHIPDFARKLGVNQAALSNFIGANFMKALQSASRKMQEEGLKAGGRRQKQRYSSIYEEIAAKTGLNYPGRFQNLDMGLMKLISPSGDDLYPVSAGDPVFASVIHAPVELISESPGSAGAKAPGTSTGQQAGAPVSTAGKTAWMPPPDRPIIKEILDKFGSVLDVHEKIVVSPFPPDFELSTEGSPINAAGSKATSATRISGGTSPSPVAPPVSRTPAWMLQDKPIIKEILERFGSILDVHEKLVIPSDITEFEEEEYSSDDQAEPEYQQQVDYGPSANFFPVELDFQNYCNLLKKVQSFQVQGDNTGYRRWLAHEASISYRAVILLKNLQGKVKKGEISDIRGEFSGVASKTGFSVEQIEDLNSRIKVFDRINVLITRLAAEVKKQSPDIYRAIHKIWTQIRMLFNEPGDAASLLTRFKIVLLQIGDEGLRQKVLNLIEPYLCQAGDLLSPRSQSKI